MQKYFGNLKAMPFKLKVKSLCCPYNLKLNERHTSEILDIGHTEKLELEPGTASDHLNIPSKTKQKKGHLPLSCPATRAGC